MPKFILFGTLCVALVAQHFLVMENPQLETLGAGDFFIYSREVVVSPLVLERTDVGFGFIYRARSENAAELRAKFNHIDGESLLLDKQMSARDVLWLLGHEKTSQQTSAGMVVTYGYSGRGRDFIVAGGERVNLQIVERGGRTKVGWPVILGSF